MPNAHKQLMHGGSPVLFDAKVPLNRSSRGPNIDHTAVSHAAIVVYAGNSYKAAPVTHYEIIVPTI